MTTKSQLMTTLGGVALGVGITSAAFLTFNGDHTAPTAQAESAQISTASAERYGTADLLSAATEAQDSPESTTGPSEPEETSGPGQVILPDDGPIDAEVGPTEEEISDAESNGGREEELEAEERPQSPDGSDGNSPDESEIPAEVPTETEDSPTATVPPTAPVAPEVSTESTTEPEPAPVCNTES